MATIFIKPANGLRIKDPISKIPLSSEGETKPNSTYWRRKINAGDVIVAKEKKTTIVQDKETEKINK